VVGAAVPKMAARHTAPNKRQNAPPYGLDFGGQHGVERFAGDGVRQRDGEPTIKKFDFLCIKNYFP